MSLRAFLRKLQYMPEPLACVYLFGLVLSAPVYEQYFYKRYSDIYGHNQKFNHADSSGVCGNSSANGDIQKKVQSAVSTFLTVNVFCMMLPSLLFGLFYGPLSDRIGRKPVIFINLSGYFIYSLVVILVEMLELNIALIHVGAFIAGCGGYLGVLTTILSAYLSDIVAAESLSFRIGMIQMIIFVALAISNFSSGFILKSFHYLGSFVIISALCLFSLLLCIFQLSESLPKDKRASHVSWYKLPKSILNMLKAPRSRKWRLKYLIPIDSMGYFNGQTVLGPIILLRLLNSPLCFTATEVGYFRGAYFFVAGVGTVLILKVLPILLNKVFVIPVGFLSVAAYLALFGLMSSDVVYISVAAGIFSYAASPMARGILADTVNDVEKGSLFALMGTLQSAIQLISTYVYQKLYRVANEKGKPGAVFVAGSLFMIIPIVVSVIYAIKEIRDERRRKYYTSIEDYGTVTDSNGNRDNLDHFGDSEVAKETDRLVT